MALKLMAEVGLNAVGFERGISRLASSARNTLLAAFGAVSFGQLIRGTVEWASKLQDSADALGVNVELLQKLQNGARTAGADIEEVTKLILELNKSRQAALLNPKGPEAKAFGRLGFSQGEISGMSTGDFTRKLIGGFAGGVTTQMANDLQEVGGRTAKSLLAAFVNQFESNAPIAKEATIQELDRIDDEFSDMATLLKVELAPVILMVASALHHLVSAFKLTMAVLGGFFSELNFKGIAKAFKTNPALGMQMLSANFKSATANAFTKGAEEMERQKKEREAIKRAREAEDAARKARENSPPEFDLSGKKQPKGERQEMPDELTRVGNFLGSTGTSFSDLAQRQLQVAQQQLATQRGILTAVQKNNTTNFDAAFIV